MDKGPVQEIRYDQIINRAVSPGGVREELFASRLFIICSLLSFDISSLRGVLRDGTIEDMRGIRESLHRSEAKRLGGQRDTLHPPEDGGGGMESNDENLVSDKPVHEDDNVLTCK